MEKYSEIATTVGRWNASDLAYVTVLQYRFENGFASLGMQALWQRRDLVDAWPSPDAPWFTVAMEFLHVTKVHVTADTNPIQVLGFSIEDIADRGWSDVKYQVDDYEDGRVSFYCADLRVERVASCVYPLTQR